ncbi:hypothetical protein BU15DRAFT_39512 [Melanogaster broomeanus]|nr:hypothetical protein BU15DRAFT_39512 [Melanogaster broomeanus]
MRRSTRLIGRTGALLSVSECSSRRFGVLSPPTLVHAKSPKDASANDSGSPPARPSSRVQRRLASSQPALPENQQEQYPPAGATSDSPPQNDPPPIPPSDPTPDKPPRKPRASSNAPPPNDRFQLPAGLDILWVPDASPDPQANPLTNNPLPPPELFDEALTNLHIALHPQTQHRAAYSSPAGPPVEPALALYCPLEGGEYIVDETVRQLACRTGAEVLVIDSVQLAAGEWGHFGKAANAIQFPRNPLHYHPHPTPSTSRHPSSVSEDNDDPARGHLPHMGISQMTLHFLAPMATFRGRPPSILAPSRSAPSPSRIQSFFDDLINMPSPSSKPSQHIRPRLIYIRDFPTLAPTVPTWYPHLLSAVRARRTGHIARPSSPVACPMAIVCGVTPPLIGAPSVPGSSGGIPMSLSMLLRRQTPVSSGSAGGHPGSEWGEDDHATQSREKRLRERLRRWERSGDAALLEDLPRLSFLSPSGPHSSGGSNDDSQTSTSSTDLHKLAAEEEVEEAHVTSAGAEHKGFFRASVILPNARDLGAERKYRMARRREINEMAMRMGVGGIGGVLEAGGRTLALDGVDSKGAADEPEGHGMWEDWSTRIESWSSIRQIADRAVGSVVSASILSSAASSSMTSKMSKTTLEPTSVSWSVVHRAWATQRSSRDLRRAWSKDARVHVPREGQLDDVTEDELDAVEREGGEEGSQVNELVEELKQDQELDPYARQVLGCIVDPTTLSTTFAQVHLPPHTIDSVRTLVSLPLLHPQAFQVGILKEHAMTGCLLFGPPGTGKTLVVRALAKEAGCRMLIVSPSDVMDMYVGEGEKLVKGVFSLARRLSPCVVFLDEIDALFGARSSSHGSGSSMAHRGVITEFMQEMDGLRGQSGTDKRVIVIGATNRPFDLDDAVLRRLPRRLLVDLPGEKEREGILNILLRDETLAPDVDVKALSRETESFSGSDLKHLCVSAALDAVKEGVSVPWKLSSEAVLAIAAPDNSSTTSQGASTSALPYSRTIHGRHFTKALKEITPSGSEALASLADLRKWNELFGEGRKDKRRVQVWGRGTFGFVDATVGAGQEEDMLSILNPPH